MFQKVLVVALLFLTSHTFAQDLEAILSDTRLPVPVQGMSVVYDGQDSIYVMGGQGPDSYHYQKDILKFNVTTQTLEKVGTMDPVAFGSAVWAGNQNLLYFGGISNRSEYQARVFSFKPDGALDWTPVGDLPSSAVYTSSVWGQGEYSYIFGGSNGTYLNTISRYSSLTNTAIVVGELPSARDSTSAVWDETTGDAYVFGGYGSGGGLNDILKFNPAEDTVVKLSVALPESTYYSCAIWTGREAYIIGGYGSSGMFHFNPSTSEALHVPVRNLPAPLYRHSCAFVKQLNRIYVFGGVNNLPSGSGRRRDEILYIDLPPSPTSPTTTTPIPMTTTTNRPGNPTDCKNEVCGTRLADPYCCKSFYQCKNQEAILRHCPSQLQFNPSHGECDLPEIVKCQAVDE